METLAQLGEDALIHRLTRQLSPQPGVLVGPGDDCAVVTSLSSTWLELLKADCIVEGVHFLRDTPPERVGWKAMARAVSDIAAMGGEPRHALVTLILPQDLPVDHVEKLYEGLRYCAEEFDVSIVGGETSSGPCVIVNVCLTGRVRRDAYATRDGAKPGDAIYVTGRLGGSLRGHHLTFTPRLMQARWLASNFHVSAMMDVSDGLGRDLPRMALASNVEFVLNEEALPVNEGCTPQQAWADGEDYELLIAVPEKKRARLEKTWSRLFTLVPLTYIGSFVPVGEGRQPSFAEGGWEHFTSPHSA